jgi:hypothetical protein
VLASKLDLSDDDMSSDVVDPQSHDLLVERSPSSESNIFRSDLDRAMSFFAGCRKSSQNGFFYIFVREL